MAVAPLLSGWWLKQGRQLPAPVRGGGNIDLVNDGAPLMVEALLDGTWVNLTQQGYVLYDQRVRLTRGQSSEAGQANAGRCSFALKNHESLGFPWSANNPESPYYGLFGRGTRIRVSVPSGFDKSYRFQGEISNVEEESDQSGQDCYVTVEAAGILDRLGRGDEALRSTLYREIVFGEHGYSGRMNLPLAYWPMEDGPDAEYLAPAFGDSPMHFSAEHPGLSTFTDFDCSEAIPNMSNSRWGGEVPSHTVDSAELNAFTVMFLFSAPAGFTVGTGIIRVVTASHRWELVYVSTNNLRLRGLDYQNNVDFDETFPFTVTDTEYLITMHWRRHSSGHTVELWSEVPGANVVIQDIDSPTSIVNTPIRNVQLNWAVTATDFYIGHVVVFQHKAGDAEDIDSPYQLSSSALVAFTGERADVRFDRLCREEGISHEVIDPLVIDEAFFDVSGVGQEMGVQRSQSLIELLRECEETDGGTLYEMTTDFGLGYRTLETITSQEATVALSHGNHELTEQPVPKRDTNRIVNDGTVSRIGGTEERVVDTTSKMSIHPYPAGVGRFNSQKSLSLHSDTQLSNQAGWMVHLGTVAEPRYEKIGVNFAHSTFIDNPTLRRTCLTVRPGDRVDVTDVPARLGYDDISQLAIGYTEEIDQFQHKISWNSVPEEPYRVAVIGRDGYDRIDAANARLPVDITSTATSFTVTSLDGTTWIDSAGYADKFPFDIRVGGERMTVTAITGTSADQVFDVTRSVNSVVKGHPAGTFVNVFNPVYLGLGGATMSIETGDQLTAFTANNLQPSTYFAQCDLLLTKTTTVQEDISGCELVIDVLTDGAILIIDAEFDCAVGTLSTTTDMNGAVVVNDVQQPALAKHQMDKTDRDTVYTTNRMSINSGRHTIKLQGYLSAAAGSGTFQTFTCMKVTVYESV